jgi:hypothetical protein
MTLKTQAKSENLVASFLQDTTMENPYITKHESIGYALGTIIGSIVRPVLGLIILEWLGFFDWLLA